MRYVQRDVGLIFHVFNQCLLSDPDVCCCCNLMIYYWRECVMSVLGTTKNSSLCVGIATWQ